MDKISLELTLNDFRWKNEIVNVTIKLLGCGAPGGGGSQGHHGSAGSPCPHLPAPLQTERALRQVSVLVTSTRTYHDMVLAVTSASTDRRGRHTAATWRPSSPTASRWGRGQVSRPRWGQCWAGGHQVLRRPLPRHRRRVQGLGQTRPHTLRGQPRLGRVGT